MARVLIRIPNWLGDAVMASGAVARYAKLHGEDEITLAGPASTLPVYENTPYRFRWIPLDRRAARRMSGLASAIATVRRERFERAYLLTNSFSSALLVSLAGVPWITGYAMHKRRWLMHKAVNPNDAPVHHAARYAYLFDSMWRMPLAPEIHVSMDEQVWAQQSLREWGLSDMPRIGFAIGAAYGGAKRWPVERYAELARRCVDAYGAQAIFFGGVEDAPICAEAVVRAGQGALSLAGQTTLRQLFALLRECRALICNDSGVMHAAAALGTPLVAIFGPTDPNATAPIGREIHILRRSLECAPCLKRVCPLGHHRCMTEIAVNDVFESVSLILDVEKPEANGN